MSARHELPLTKLTDQQLDNYLKEFDQPFNSFDQKDIEASLQQKIHPKRKVKFKLRAILAAAVIFLAVGATIFAARMTVKKPETQSTKRKKTRTALQKARAQAFKNKISFEEELKSAPRIAPRPKAAEEDTNKTAIQFSDDTTAMSISSVSIPFNHFKSLITKTSFSSENTIYQVFVEKVYDGDPRIEGKTMTIKVPGGKQNNSIVQTNGYDPAAPGTEVVIKIPSYANRANFTAQDHNIFYRTPKAKQFTLHRPADLSPAEKKTDQEEEAKINQMVKHGVTPARTKYLAVLAKARKSGRTQENKIYQIPRETYNKPAEVRIGYAKNFAEMDQKSSATVEGVVTAWTKVPNAKNTAVTILSVYVYRGLTAKSKNLAGKTIYVYQQGGYNTRRNILNGMSSTLSEQELNQEIFYERLDFPVARIGTEVVLNLAKVSKNTLPKGEKVIDLNKSYSLFQGEKSIWVKNEGGQYQFEQALGIPVEGNSAGDQEITAEINRLTAKN
ncbi:hypothetical protein [Xylocopilactobacillus apicola]|uniref:DUF4367 domain-containing protein n=1 Tax=Xylocopilactobacillus apicola TaxID=2932184 RepID=A0AAU9DPU0_9LACO|nr:hypothetical protein [Xylocopilactobacillus apicola]BDR59202.1 hypothetical protein XA3_16430 [Xylocopilactobacillus apicola]